VDYGRAGRADRYVDLALVAAEIQNQFGEQWLEPLFRAYGIDLASADAGKLGFYSDLCELF